MSDERPITWQFFFTNAGMRFASLHQHADGWHIVDFESTIEVAESRAEALKIIDELRRRFDGR